MIGIFAFLVIVASPLWAASNPLPSEKWEQNASELRHFAGIWEFNENGKRHIFRDFNRDGSPEEEVLIEPPYEYRAFKSEGNFYRFFQIQKRLPDGISRQLYYWSERFGQYRELKSIFVPHKIYASSEVNHCSSNNSEMPGAIDNFSKMFPNLLQNIGDQYKSLDEVCQKSFDTKKIKESLAEILSSFDRKDGRYLGCLKNLNAKSTAAAIVTRIIDGPGTKPKLKLACESSLKNQHNSGTYSSKEDIIKIHTQNTSDYTKTLFHEMLHAVGIEDENHVHALERCCSSEQNQEACATARKISKEQQLMLAFHVAFSENIEGFDTFWKSFVATKDAATAEKYFLVFALEAEKLGQKYSGEMQRCLESNDIAFCVSEIQNEINRELQSKLLSLCSEQILTPCNEQLATPCNEQHQSAQAGCKAFSDRLKTLVENAYQKMCLINPQRPQDGQTPCATKAYAAASRALREAPNLSVSYSEITGSFAPEHLRYLSSLRATLAKRPAFDELRKKLSGHLGNFIDDANVIQNTYLEVMDRMLSKQPGKFDLQSVLKANEEFFSFFCPSTIFVGDFRKTDEICADLKLSSDSAWRKTAADCTSNENCIKKTFDQAKANTKEVDPKYTITAKDMKDVLENSSDLAAISAIERTPGGEDLIAKVQLEGEGAMNVLQFYIKYIRAGGGAGTNLPFLNWKECLKTQPEAVCGEKAEAKFAENNRKYFEEFCPKYFSLGNCQAVKTIFQESLNKLTCNGGEVQSSPKVQSSSFACIAKVMEKAQEDFSTSYRELHRRRQIVNIGGTLKQPHIQNVVVPTGEKPKIVKELYGSIPQILAAIDINTSTRPKNEWPKTLPKAEAKVPQLSSKKNPPSPSPSWSNSTGLKGTIPGASRPARESASTPQPPGSVDTVAGANTPPTPPSWPNSTELEGTIPGPSPRARESARESASTSQPPGSAGPTEDGGKKSANSGLKSSQPRGGTAQPNNKDLKNASTSLKYSVDTVLAVMNDGATNQQFKLMNWLFYKGNNKALQEQFQARGILIEIGKKRIGSPNPSLFYQWEPGNRKFKKRNKSEGKK